MFFDALLFSSDCLLTGQTSCQENKSRVSLQTESGETILFFRTDSPEFRSSINATNEKVCDVLILYAKQDTRVICFCELKRGSQINDAKEQIISTHHLLTRYIDKNRSFLNWQFKAAIIHGGSSPQDVDKIKQELAKRICTSTKNVTIERSGEIGNFLRGLGQKSKGKRKNRKNR